MTDCRRCEHYENMRCNYADRPVYNPTFGYCNHYLEKEDWTHISTGLLNEYITEGDYTININKESGIISLEFSHQNIMFEVGFDKTVGKDIINGLKQAIMEINEDGKTCE